MYRKQSGSKSQLSDTQFIQASMKAPLLEKHEEIELAQAWKSNRDEKALHKLIQSYARLVISMAIKFKQYGLPLNDIIQEGNLGLMIAAERFDPGRDVRFSTYAKWWVRSTMQDFVLRNWSIVRTGSTTAQKQLFFNLRRLRAQLEKVDMDIISPQDKETIANTLHVSIKDVEQMEGRLASHDLSLSEHTSDVGVDRWQDLIRDERATPEVETSNAELAVALNNWIQAAVMVLSPRERDIIIARRLTDTPATLEDLGQEMHISKERVRQLEARAMRKMRFYLMKSLGAAKDFLEE